jgi:hypothetical protein
MTLGPPQAPQIHTNPTTPQPKACKHPLPTQKKPQ